MPDDATAAGYLRRDLFHPGWLTQSWDRCSRWPPTAFGYEFLLHRFAVGTDPGRKTGSPDRWSSDLFDVITSTGAELVWQESPSLLGGPMAGWPGNWCCVAVAGGPVPVGDFRPGSTRPAAPAAGSFPTTLLTGHCDHRVGCAGNHRRPAQRARLGLGIICAATQFSDALVPDQIRSGPVAAAAEWTTEAGRAPIRVHHRCSPATGPSDEFRAPDLGKGFEF